MRVLRRGRDRGVRGLRGLRAVPGAGARRAQPARGLQGHGAVQPRRHAARAGVVGRRRRDAGGRALGHGVHAAAPAAAEAAAARADAALGRVCGLRRAPDDPPTAR